VHHCNRSTVDGILKAVGEKLDVLRVNVEENAVVPDLARDVVLRYTDNNTSPPLLPPELAPTLKQPKSTKTTPPQWMDESTVRILSCPASGVQDSEGMDAIIERQDIWSVDDNDGEHMEVENALPGCIFQLPSACLKRVSSRRKLRVDFDIINIDGPVPGNIHIQCSPTTGDDQ
jgi:hypothetical protein